MVCYGIDGFDFQFIQSPFYKSNARINYKFRFFSEERQVNHCISPFAFVATVAVLHPHFSRYSFRFINIKITLSLDILIPVPDLILKDSA